MAEEPQPPNVHEGADAPDVLPANAEDRAAAQAMSSLDARPDEDAAPKKELDIKALNDAMKNLGAAQGEGKSAVAAGTKKDEAPKKLVKVDQADVALLVSTTFVLWEFVSDGLGSLGGPARYVQGQGNGVAKSARCGRRQGYDCVGYGGIVPNNSQREHA